MTVPAFVPQSSSTLTPIRYHDALDPYHYTVDNRPLSDLATNIAEIGTQGIDAAKRASLIGEIADNIAFESLFGETSAISFFGLRVGGYSGGNLYIDRGGLNQVSPVFAGYGANTMRRGVLVGPVYFSAYPPGTAGQSIDYLVQVRIAEFLPGSVSSFPYYESSNPYISGSTQTGELIVQVKSGSAAPIGSQVTPTADAGFTPLYRITSTNGQESVIELAVGAPARVRRMSQLVDYADSAPGSSAAVTNIGGMNAARFNNGVDSSIAFPVSLRHTDFCVVSPIRLRMALSSTSTGSANVVFRLDAKAIWNGHYMGAGSSAYTTSETINIPSGPDVCSMNPDGTTSLKVPPFVFAGFNNGYWNLASTTLILQLTRLGSDAADTVSGSVDLINLEVIQ